MVRDREMPDVAKLGIGLGIGVGIGYLLSRLFGVGGGGPPWPGAGRRADAGHGLPAPAVPARPPALMPASPVPARPRDEVPVEIRVRPSATDPEMTVIEMEGRVVSVGELADRVGAGGRRDVRVTVRGDARQGGWEEIRQALEFLGIQILLRQS